MAPLKASSNRYSRRFRQRRRPSKATTHLFLGTSLLAFTYLCCVLRGFMYLNNLPEDRSATEEADNVVDDNVKRFIIFSDIKATQGAGNIMAGLLAVHMLATEFNRIVCIDPGYEEFLDAFEPIHPDAKTYCPDMLQGFDAKSMRQTKNFIQLVNFGRPPDECKLRELLQSNDTLLIEGNTYPRWTEVTEDNMFFKYYQARPNLLSILPYTEAPSSVVHLRAPDSMRDHREGIDEDSLRFLFREMIPKGAFVVCNRVKWYDLFDELGLRHPTWQLVSHSAFHASWGSRTNSRNVKLGVFAREQLGGDKFNRVANLQMWADWYTILTAENVYHTHSDFSGSAAHWQKLNSKRILGEGRNLRFEEETWKIDGVAPRLVDRIHTSYDETDPTQLAKCGLYPERGDAPILSLAVENDEPHPEVGKLRVVDIIIHDRPPLPEVKDRA